MSARADRVLEAILRDPDLLFEVVAKTQTLKVASGWIKDPNNHTKLVRQNPRRKTVAFVKRHSTRSVLPWEGSTRKREGDEERPSKSFTTQGEALEWCDDQLRRLGYTLTNAEP